MEMMEENESAILENATLGKERRSRSEKPKVAFHSLHNLESEASDDDIDNEPPVRNEKPISESIVIPKMTPKATSSTKRRSASTRKKQEKRQRPNPDTPVAEVIARVSEEKAEDLESVGSTSEKEHVYKISPKCSWTLYSLHDQLRVLIDLLGCRLNEKFLSASDRHSGSDESLKAVLHLRRPTKKYLKAGVFCSDGASRTEPMMALLTLTLEQNRQYGFNLDEGGFLLPYDLWWQYRYQKEFTHLDPSGKYKKLRCNIGFDTKPAPGLKSEICGCNPTDNCGANCLNRIMFIECDPNKCPCRERCTNNSMQKKGWLDDKIEEFKCGDKGVGVRSTAKIEKGAFICEYVGEWVSRKTFNDRMATWYKDCDHHYALSVDAVTYIDAYRSGSIARFLNHSCTPNCEMQKWSINGCYRMGIFAVRDIEPGEELCFDYKFHAFNKSQRCLCGSQECRGLVGIGDDEDDRQPTRKGKPKKSILRGDFVYFAPQSKAHELVCVMKPISGREKALITKGRLFLNRNVNKERRKLKSRMDARSWTLLDDPQKAEFIDSYFMDRGKAHLRWRRLHLLSDVGARLRKLIPLARFLKSRLTTLTRSRSRTNFYVDQQPVVNHLVDNSISVETLVNYAESCRYADVYEFDKDLSRLFEQMKAKLTPSENGISDSIADLERWYESKKSIWFGESDSDGNEKKNLNVDGVKDRPDELYWASNVPLIGTCDIDDTDEFWSRKADSFDPSDDKVHCVCGSFLDFGKMVQCSECSYWQHCDCVGDKSMLDDYVCEFCTSGNLAILKEIVKLPQPGDGFSGCVYYSTLVKDGFQIRIGEFVYVKRMDDEFVDSCKKQLLLCNSKLADESSATMGLTISTTFDDSVTIASEEISENSAQRCGSMYRRSDLSIVFVERLLIAPSGTKFIFGRHFVRPHKTRCNHGQLFYRNEVFDTPLFDALPIEAVVGRCLVLNVWTYCQGRPKCPKYTEEDIYVCEHRLDKDQGLFNKKRVIGMPPISKKQYIFEKFPEKLKIKRDFSPFMEVKEPERLDSVGSPMTIGKETGVGIHDSNLIRKKRDRVERLIDMITKD